MAATTPAISDHCIYTIRHTRDLEAAIQSGGRGTFTENTKWSRGYQLFQAAQHAGTMVPIIFSAAERESGLIFYGFLEAISMDETNPEQTITTYAFTGLRPIGHPLPKSHLVLQSTQRALSDQYIRLYAVCDTPDFVRL
jgi:hypothetical protein